MKKTIFIYAILILGFSSCVTSHNGLTSNVNSNSTQVVLSKNNYIIRGRVEGSASASNWFWSRKGYEPLIARARSEMLENARLRSTSKAVINEIVEINYQSNLLFGFQKKKVTVSAYVIEFVDEFD